MSFFRSSWPLVALLSFLIAGRFGVIEKAVNINFDEIIDGISEEKTLEKLYLGFDMVLIQ